MRTYRWVGWCVAIVAVLGLVGQGLADDEGGARVPASAVAYVPGKPDVKGHLAVPRGDGPFPGLVVIHEWWGLNDQIRSEAERLAAAGFVALAVDLYDGTVATTPDAARAAMRKVDPDSAVANMNAAVAYLQGMAQVGPVGSIGWCFGGGQSLRLALNNPDLSAAVIYYGSLVTDPDVLKQIACPVLGQFGAEDHHPSPEHVAAFREGLEAAGVPHEIYSYEGANHAFANPTGSRYNPSAAAKAWERTMAFLRANLTAAQE